MANRIFIVFLTICGLLLIFTTSQYFLRNTTSQSLPILGKVSSFTLYDEEGKPFTLENLQGKIWIANFFFTTCADVCPVMSARMASLHRSFELEKDVHLVSFTVNPEQDSPQVLSQYAKRFKANTDKWHFLTGSREELTQIAVQSFKLGDVKEPIFHSTYFCLVDREGRIRGYYEGMKKEGINQLFKDASVLLKRGIPSTHSPFRLACSGWFDASNNGEQAKRVEPLPTINACLNGLSFIFLFLGWRAIKARDQQRHKQLMLMALTASFLFLCSYLTYHFLHQGLTRYQGEGIWRFVYFFILLTHTPLAAIIVPFCIAAVYFALKGDFKKHTAITVWLLPVWMYVSLTGVLIYLMLYVF